MQKETPLPLGYVAFIFVTALLGMMTTTMLFSYQPQLLRHFHIPEVDIGYYAALLSGSCYFAKMIFSIFWGILADTLGRKEAVLLTATSMAISTILFGFSTTYQWALTARFLQGMSFAIIACSKTYIAELCDETNAVRGVSFLMAAMTTSFVIGPSFSGFLVFPTKQYPSVFSKDGFFYRYPIALPNLFIAGILLILVTIGIFYLPKSELAKTKRKEKNEKPRSIKDRIVNSNISKLLRDKLVVSTCFVFGFSSYCGVGYAEMFPLYTSTTYEYHGLEFTSRQIGISFLVVYVVSTMSQLIVLPKVIKAITPKKTYMIYMITNALAVTTLPLANLCSSNRIVEWLVAISSLLISRVGLGGALLASNVMINNSVLRSQLGTVNGIAFSISGFARMLSVASLASSYSWSLTNIKGVAANLHPLGFPFNEYFVFILLSIVAILGCIIIYFTSDSVNSPRKSEKQT